MESGPIPTQQAAPPVSAAPAAVPQTAATAPVVGLPPSAALLPEPVLQSPALHSPSLLGSGGQKRDSEWLDFGSLPGTSGLTPRGGVEGGFGADSTAPVAGVPVDFSGHPDGAAVNGLALQGQPQQVATGVPALQAGNQLAMAHQQMRQQTGLPPVAVNPNAAATAAAAAQAAAGAIAEAQGQLAKSAAQPPGAAGPSKVLPPTTAAMAAAPAAPQPLHFVTYKQEKYMRNCDPDPPVPLRRWLLADSQGRWHLAVDTTKWANSKYEYSAVSPFSVVRPMRCKSMRDVERYLDQYIPPHNRRHPSEGPPPPPPPPRGQAAKQAAAQQAAAAAANAANGGSEGGAAGQTAAGASPMEQYGTGMQPAGVKRKPGRPRIHPPKDPKQPQQENTPASMDGGASAADALVAMTGDTAPTPGLELAATPATGAAPNTTPGAAQAAEDGDDGEEAAAATAGVLVRSKCRGRRPTLADASFIEGEERREQVYELRLDAALSELALLKAQCGVDYSLTLVGQDRHVEVLTSAIANVHAVKVVRRQRQVEKPPHELAPAGGGSSAAAAAAAAAAAEEEEKERLEEEGAVAALAGAAAGSSRRGRKHDRAEMSGAGTDASFLSQQQQQQQHFMAMQQHYTTEFMSRMQALAKKGKTPTPEMLQECHTAATKHAMEAMAAAMQMSDGGGKEGARAGKRRGRPPASAKASDTPAPPTKRMKAADGRPAQPVTVPIDPDIRQLAERLKDDIDEPYMPGVWRQQPYEETGLEEIEEFVVAEDCGEARDAVALPAKLDSDLVPDEKTAGAPGSSDELMVLAQLPQGLASGEVDVRPVWGIDKYTRRFIWEALGLCRQLGSPNTVQLDEARKSFIEQHLLPALNRRDKDGWDIMSTLQQLAASSKRSIAAAAATLMRAVTGVEAYHNKGMPCTAADRQHFRVHPKGEGVVLLRDGGLPAGAFVAEYLGELYSAWRWLERDARASGRGAIASNKRMLVRLGTSDEFYNIALERPPADRKGFDVMFVNAAAKGNFTSRLCHSCEPNCKTVPMVANGRITIGVWTIRPVSPGEELTLDWACETDNERECQNATCLCGTAVCRGSFMYLLKSEGTGPLHQYAAAHHTFLQRCHLLLQVANEPQPTEDEEARLYKHGFKESILTDGIPYQGGIPLPAWLRRWAAFILEFIDQEAKELTALLKQQLEERQKKRGRHAASRAARKESGSDEEEEEEEDDAAQSVEAIESDVESHRKGRLQALAFALDKAKMILRHQGSSGQRVAPLRLMSEREAVQFLWTADDSVARRAVASLAAYTQRQQADGLVRNRQPRNAAPPAWLEDALEPETLEPPVRRPPRRAAASARKLHNAALLGALSAAPSGANSSGAALLAMAAAGSESVGLDDDEQQEQQQDGEEQEHPGQMLALMQEAMAQAEGQAEEAPSLTAAAVEAAAMEVGPGAAAGVQQEQEREGAAEDEETEPEFETLAEQLENMVDDAVVTTLADAQAGLRRLAAALREAGTGHAGLHDVLLLYASVRHWVAQVEYTSFEPQLTNGKKGSRYRPQHLWAILSCWWRAGSGGDPMSWLTTERRGCFSLPETDNCYLPIFTSGDYVKKGVRSALLKHIESSSAAAWPPNTSFSFKNVHKVYGSPQLDAVLDGNIFALEQVVQELKDAY